MHSKGGRYVSKTRRRAVQMLNNVDCKMFRPQRSLSVTKCAWNVLQPALSIVLVCVSRPLPLSIYALAMSYYDITYVLKFFPFTLWSSDTCHPTPPPSWCSLLSDIATLVSDCTSTFSTCVVYTGLKPHPVEVALWVWFRVLSCPSAHTIYRGKVYAIATHVLNSQQWPR